MKSEYFDKILDLLIEDYFNLYEVYWFVKSNWNNAENEALDISMEVLRGLYNDGYVTIYKREGYNGKVKKMSPNEVKIALDSQESWQVPNEESLQVVVTVTSKGEKRHYGTKNN